MPASHTCKHLRKYSVGAAYGSKFSIWDITKLEGGKPTMSGISFPEGSRHFR